MPEEPYDVGNSVGGGRAVLILLVWILGISCFDHIQAETDTRTAPWDARDPAFAQDLATVEKHHLNRDVQTLTRGQGNAYPAPDLTFILRYFPNHHRGLYLLSVLDRRHSNDGKIPGLDVGETADLYFEKATAFTPDDGIVWMLYGMHLYQTDRDERAAMCFDKALQLEPNAAEVHYNAGLFFLHVGNGARSLEHAQRAYEMGYPLPGLKKKLIRAGYWEEKHASANQ